MKSNGIIIVDKPKGMTSHTVVSRLRRILNTRRVGHTGTLDPMATGVLPVLFGVATKLSEQLSCDDKAYTAVFRLGITTDTQDITGTVLSQSPVWVSFEEVSRVVAEKKGRQEQIPPMYSAIKVEGRKLYELARSGLEIERTPRQITIYSSEVLGTTPEGDYEAQFEVSKGTYIRTLVDDIGRQLGCGATLTELRRTQSGRFDISKAYTLDELCDLNEKNSLDTAIIDMDKVLLDLPFVTIEARQVQRIKNGVQIPAEEIIGCDGLPVILDTCCGFSAEETVRLYDEQGVFFALGNFKALEDGVKLCLFKSLWGVSS